MKRLRTWIGAAVLSVVVTGAAAAQSAQSPPSAATVLANVERFYANANQLTALFRHTVTIATFRVSKISDGKLWVLKPSYFRWDYMTKQNGNVAVTKTFAFDGTSLWVIDHTNKQIVQSQSQSSAFSTALLFLTGGNALSAQFNVSLDTSGTYGGQGDFVLELTPNQPSAQYSQLHVVVDPSNWRVNTSVVVDSNGATNRFDFVTPDLTSTVKASWFQVNPVSLPTYKVVPLPPTSPPGPAPLRRGREP